MAKRGGPARGFTVKGLRERATGHVKENTREFLQTEKYQRKTTVLDIWGRGADAKKMGATKLGE